MISLRNPPLFSFSCPDCQCKLVAVDWHIPGMRALARLSCTQCQNEYYADLPTGHGLDYPCLLEARSGRVLSAMPTHWFASWLEKSYRNRTSKPLLFNEYRKKPITRPILLNCLDKYFGHSLLKLLNAQFYLDSYAEFDLIVLVPEYMKWLVPDEVTAIWTIELERHKGTEWNDWLGGELKRRLEPYSDPKLAIAFSHPHPSDYQIERFTRVRPKQVSDTDVRFTRPVVTYIWREDRLWEKNKPIGLIERILKRLRLFPETLLREAARVRQVSNVIRLAESLRRKFPDLDFAVAGIGDSVRLPIWMKNLVRKEGEISEKDWCLRYAESDVVVGVHGSSMLLPTALSASFVELVTQDKWGNILQDSLTSIGDGREVLFRYRHVPAESEPETVANICASILFEWCGAMLYLKRPWNDHVSMAPEKPLLFERTPIMQTWSERCQLLAHLARERARKETRVFTSLCRSIQLFLKNFRWKRTA